MTAQEFGALLREKRLGKGLTLEELSARIKLSVRMLQSIEDGDLESLPHRVYARGFVRSYAVSVGMDQETMEAGLADLFPSLQSGQPQEAPLPGPLDRQRVTSGRKGLGDRLVGLVVLLILVVLPVVAGWFIVTRYGDSLMEWGKHLLAATSDTRVDDRPADAVPPEAALGGHDALEQPAEGEENSSAAEEPFAEPVASAVVPEATDALSTQEAGASVAAGGANGRQIDGAEQAVESVPAAASALSAEDAAAGGRNGENTLQIVANATCWVKATADGAGSRTVTLQKGETSFFPFKRTMALTLGNAGGVALRYNGQPFDLNAKSGEVKTINFPPR